MDIVNFQPLVAQQRYANVEDLKSEDLIIVGKHIDGTRSLDQYPNFVVSAKDLIYAYRKATGIFLAQDSLTASGIPTLFDFYGNETSVTIGAIIKMPDLTNVPNLSILEITKSPLQEWPKLKNTNIIDFKLLFLEDSPYTGYPAVALTNFDGAEFPTSIESINVSGNITFDDYLELNTPSYPNLTLLNLTTNNLSQANVDAQLQSAYNFITGPYNSTNFNALFLDGGTNATPSATGLALVASLTALGVIVTTN